jgi:WS/DGAT/MGAT family acyltransferase
MVDGLAAVQLGLVLLDADPEGGMRVEATPAATSAPPPGSALMADAIRDTFEATVGVVRSGLDALRRPAALARGMGAELGGARSLASLSRLAPRMPFSGIEVGARRRIAAVRLPLAAAKEVKDAFGTTVNDVVLATVAEAIHGFLAHRSDPGHGVTCRVLVPVSRRGEAEAAAMGNGLAGMFVDLPVGPLAPGVRLRTIARGVGDLKVRRQASATDRLMSLASLAPQPLRSLGLRVAVRQQRLVNMVVSNVPGVQMPLYAGGARLLEAYPLLPLAPNLGLTICVLSYAGTLHFGVVADIGAFPDLEILTDGLASGMARLTAAARARARLAG